ncbi:LysR family transcriptional regulator [Paralimibaculum aggregatum]|uniref:LysR family transcriptional regulator n=1 Tax=Paralimibaculum aggregatum TaxID=3036245 RepID=A0ABQ6LL42_9RHOB|nr:LysR substrate-binding domain-containing protein [Limibaculum sp. NKW23]GMG83941.1 LysR family transcriptional regulator [Limibaculum sp. NKW23]
MSFTLKQLRYFLAAAEAGQVSAAATAVNVSQSAVTLALRDLEAALGVKLFERRPTGLELTREGRAFMNCALAIQDQVARAMHCVARVEDPLTGTLRIGVTDTLSSYFLFPRLAQFRREHPGLEIRLKEALRPELEAGLLGGEIDAALLITARIEHRDRLETRIFHRSVRRLWAAAGHPLTERPRISLADLAEHDLVMLRSDESEHHARSMWGQFGLEPKVVFESASIEAVRNMVAHGMAIAVLSDALFRSWTVDGLRVVRRSLVEQLPTLDFGVAWHRDRPPGPALLAFAELFGRAEGEPEAGADGG